MTVSFQYYSDNEDGRDDYRFSKESDALEKFESLKEIIRIQFIDCANAEVIDEPDFFGIIDHQSGDWAKVVIMGER